LLPIKLLPAVLIPVLLAGSLASATSCVTKAQFTKNIGAVVTILPQAEFVKSVGGEKIESTVMVPSGANPHTYEPTASQMTAVSKAKIYAKVGSGIEFELVWLDKLIAVNKDMLMVDCSRGVTFLETADTNQHAATDPHIWMSPSNARIMVRNICDGLIQADPDNRAYYQQNRDTYLQKLAQLDQDIKSGLSGVTNRTFMTYHPAFGYFARDYDLTMLPIAAEGKEPTPAGLVQLIEQAREHNVKVVFASPQFNPESAEVIAGSIGGKVVYIDPLAGDYMANLRSLLNELVQAME